MKKIHRQVIKGFWDEGSWAALLIVTVGIAVGLALAIALIYTLTLAIFR